MCLGVYPKCSPSFGWERREWMPCYVQKSHKQRERGADRFAAPPSSSAPRTRSQYRVPIRTVIKRNFCLIPFDSFDSIRYDSIRFDSPRSAIPRVDAPLCGRPHHVLPHHHHGMLFLLYSTDSPPPIPFFTTLFNFTT